MKATTKTGKEATFIGGNVSVNGVTFDWRGTETGVKSARLVNVAGKMHPISLEFSGADLTAVRAYVKAYMDALKSEYYASDDYKIEQEKAARRAFANKIHSGHGDAAASK